jgi:hypothetical protein
MIYSLVALFDILAERERERERKRESNKSLRCNYYEIACKLGKENVCAITKRDKL